MDTSMETSWEQARELFQKGNRANALLLQIWSALQVSEAGAGETLVIKNNISFLLPILPYLSFPNGHEAVNTIFDRVLQLSTQEHKEWDIRHLLKSAGRYFSESQKQYVYEVAGKISDGYARSNFIRYMADFASVEMLERLLGMALSIENDWIRGTALAGLGNNYPVAWQEEILDAIFAMKDEHARKKAFCGHFYVVQGCLPALRKDLIPLVLDDALRMQQEVHRVATLAGLVPFLDESQRLTLFEEIDRFTNDTWRYWLLSALIPYLSQEQIPAALEMTRQIDDPYGDWRAHMLGNLVPLLPEAQRDTVAEEALQSALKEPPYLDNVATLIKLLPLFGKPKQVELISHIFDIVHEIEDEYDRFEALPPLAPYTEGALWERLISTIDQAPHDYLRADELGKTVAKIPYDRWATEGLAVIDRIIAGDLAYSGLRKIVDALKNMTATNISLAFDIYTHILWNMVRLHPQNVRGVVIDFLPVTIILAGDDKQKFADDLYQMVIG